MTFDTPLVPGTLIKREKRFLAHVRLEDGTQVVAHTPNTGSMRGCAQPGVKVWLSHAPDPARKLAYTWELSCPNGVWVGVHTGRPNQLVAQALAAGVIPELAGFSQLRREVKYGENSRIDLLLEYPPDTHTPATHIPPTLVEVKNVTLRVEGPLDGSKAGKPVGVAAFPDAVTERGRKHLAEMTREVAQGKRAAMVFAVQRTDCRVFRPADHIDPQYGQALREAMAAGVKAYAVVFGVVMEGGKPVGLEAQGCLPVDVETPLA